MTLKLILDRYEEDIGVCLDFDDKRYLISKEILGDIEVNDIFTIEYDGAFFSRPIKLTEETERAKAEVREKMNRLFKKHSERKG